MLIIRLFLSLFPLQLGTKLTQLVELSLSGQSGVTLSNVTGFDSLHRLDLSSCEGLVHHNLCPALERLTGLTSLNLDNCVMLSQLCLTMPRLQVREFPFWVALVWALCYECCWAVPGSCLPGFFEQLVSTARGISKASVWVIVAALDAI